MDKQTEFVLRTLEERDIRFVRLWFTDVLGTLKSVAVAPAELEGAFAEGLGFDGSAIEGFARVYESDMLAKPDPSTFAVLPWRSEGPGSRACSALLLVPRRDRGLQSPRRPLRLRGIGRPRRHHEPPTGTKVVCLSCHVSHTSREAALYPYSGDDRCLACHTTGVFSVKGRHRCAPFRSKSGHAPRSAGGRLVRDRFPSCLWQLPRTSYVLGDNTLRRPVQPVRRPEESQL